MPTGSAPVRLRWQPSVRLVSADFPVFGVIHSATGPVDMQAVLRTLELTSSFRQGTARAYAALPAADQLHGPGVWDALTPFLYATDGRFSSVGRGAYYAAADTATAEAEWLFHVECRLRASGATRGTVDARELHSDLDLPVTDTRGTRTARPALYDPVAGGTDRTRAFAAALPTPGLVYDSLRWAGGDCVAIFRPSRVGVPVREANTLRFDWSLANGWYRHP